MKIKKTQKSRVFACFLHFLINIFSRLYFAFVRYFNEMFTCFVYFFYKCS